MIARALGFTRADLLEMDWSEMCQVWLPEVERMQKEESE